MALEATKLVFDHVQTAYTNGADTEAREAMLTAAYKAGVAFSKSYVGYIHAIAHSLGGTYGVPHGLANAVTMPYVLEAYGESAYKALHRLGVYAGVCSVSDTPEVGAKAFIAAIRDMNASMGIPETIRDIRKEDIPAMALHAEKEANPLYPVPRLMTQKELEILYYQMVDGSESR